MHADDMLTVKSAEFRGDERAGVGVSERTVRNDIERLRALDYPIDATRGAAGGYRLGVGGQMPPLLLDDDEAVAMVLGLRAATGLTGIEETSLRALTKLEQMLPHRLRRRVAALAAYAVAVPADTPSPQVDADLLSMLAACCRDTERLRFDYLPYAGDPSRRDVEPHRLITWDRRWYLLAWDLERSGWRTFRIDRISPRLPTGPRFSPRPLPADDVAAYVSGNASAAAWRHTATVVVHAPAPGVAERIPASAGTVEVRDEGSCVFRTGADSLDTIVVHLSLLGVEFEIVDPPELVDRVREMAGRYIRASGGAASAAFESAAPQRSSRPE